ncbi:pentatricopeptide repeat-containing protein At2g27610-like [Juglans regia]|uniref:Pentatricopeptide repeat-containing protein At2g27610-like n=1 Tax=Juglans regia TaxID=51240 RepID=A0A6P9E0G6_JUGRE|nr:pentatricopeptide repeat-containing protein At2g27610-like [Juglans regia]
MSFGRLLRLFGDARCIPKGRAVHGKIITSGFRPDVYANNHLISLYAKSNRMDDARKVFDAMPERNLISWTALISGYSQTGFEEEALNCFRLMVIDGFNPNPYTYVGAISACASIGDTRAGKEIHGRIYRHEQELNGRVSNCLINMYGKCGLLSSARLVFDATLKPDLVSWTSILACYCQCGENLEGLKIFMQSQKEGVEVSEFSCASMLGACAALENLKVGMQLHSLVIKCALGLDNFVMTALINLYAKCGELHSSHRAFLEVDKPQLQAWTALMGGYAQQGKERDAIDLFHKFHSSGLKPGERTFSSVLGAFANMADVEVGKQLHSLIIKMGFISFIFVGNAVLDFYSKCGLLGESSKTFEEMLEHDVVSWNALIFGHLRSGHHGEAVELLKDMLIEGFEPNLYTYSSILSICGDLPAIEWGRQTHCCIMKPGFNTNVVVGSALIDMYAKCGRVSEAQKVFDNLITKNLVSWNTMLVGYAQHGFGREALEIYNMMQRNGIEPNDITFLGVLSACGHVGLVEEGWGHFNSMIRDHGIAPRTDHIASLVSLFARKGQTKRAFEFIRSFPMDPDKVVWRCLLSGCKIHKNLALARYAAEKILSIDPEDTSAHITLSNIYAEAKMWNEVAKVRKIMKIKDLKKDTGYSWAELKNKIYYFSASHYRQFQETNLHQVLDGLTEQLFDAGYVPDAMFLLHPSD